MRTNALLRLGLVFMILGMLATSGCNDRQAVSGPIMQNASTKAYLGLKDLEKQAGLAFSTNAVLVASDDGGGRDSSLGFYVWTVFSPSPIEMPHMQAPGVKDYLHLPLNVTVKYVQVHLGGEKITQPQSALCSDWQTNGYEFSGTILRTAQGDYLVVERFRKK